MKESKYIELLRHYLFEKIDESNEEFKNSQTEFVTEVVSTIFSALVSAIAAEALVQTSSKSPFSYLSLTVVLSATYFGLRKLIEWIIRIIRSRRKHTQYTNKELDARQKQKLIAKFDNVACDGLILSYDFLRMHDEKAENIADQNLREFYLFEAFYYFKKTLDIVALLLDYDNDCIDYTGGVARYRVRNVYHTLVDIETELHKRFFLIKSLHKKEDLLREIDVYEERLVDVAARLGIQKARANIMQSISHKATVYSDTQD